MKLFNKPPAEQVFEQQIDQRSFGERMSDTAASIYGSWRFIIGQSIFMLFWMICNSIPGLPHWDEQPFILLNLMLSFEAAYCGSFLQMAANRSAAKDRAIFEHDYESDLRSEATVLELKKEVEELNSLVSQLVETKKSKKKKDA